MMVILNPKTEKKELTDTEKIRLDIHRILIGIFILLLLTGVLHSANERRDNQLATAINTLAEIMARESMCSPEISSYVTPEGYYSSDGFMCIWLEGRTEEEIIMTKKHEICHKMVIESYDEFCFEPYKKR